MMFFNIDRNYMILWITEPMNLQCHNALLWCVMTCRTSWQCVTSVAMTLAMFRSSKLIFSLFLPSSSHPQIPASQLLRLQSLLRAPADSTSICTSIQGVNARKQLKAKKAKEKGVHHHMEVVGDSVKFVVHNLLTV